MGKVVNLDTARRTPEVRQAVEDDVPTLLRWVAGDVYWLAHRRDPVDRRPIALCGAPGDLVLAPPGVPGCPQCWPEASGQ